MKVKELLDKNKFTRAIWASARCLQYLLGLWKHWDDNTVKFAEMYMTDLERKNRHYVKAIMTDAIFCTIYYQMDAIEYFLFGFKDLNAKGRSKYIGKREKGIINHSINKGDDYNIFLDKWRTYEHFKPFYKRDVIKVEEECDWNVFQQFTEMHQSFIVKPMELSCGEGVFIVDLNNERRELREIFEDIRRLGRAIVEELVVQDYEMSKFHSKSVNTIRFVTFLDKEKVHFLFSGIRMGVHGNFVDNASAGGLMAGIDIDSGVVITPAYMRNGDVCVFHPDSECQIVGTHIPQWDELLKFVTELAKVIPSQKLIGWDLALTEKGWVMIEGNQNPAFTSVQIWEKKGLREKLMKFGIV